MKKLTQIVLVMMVTLLNIAAYSQASEEAEIKKVIENETNFWLNRNTKGMMDCWASIPHVSQTISLLHDVVSFKNANEFKLSDPYEGVSIDATNTDVERSNWNIRVVGNAAYVTFKELDIEKDGHRTYLYEGRFMEKMDGKWKIVASNVVAYLP